MKQRMNQAKSIWIFSHYAKQPPTDSLRYHNWGKILVAKGYSVTIFAASSEHNSQDNRISGHALYVTDRCDGVDYVYIRARSYAANGLRRMFGMADYFFGLRRTVKSFPKPDLILAASPHLLTPFAGILTARRLSVPCVSDMVDLWPRSIVEYGKFNEKNPLIQMLYRLEHWIYRKSDAVIFSMEGGKQYLVDRGWDRTVDLGKVFYINMGVDLPLYDMRRTEVPFSDPDLCQENIFKVVYCGAVRQANYVQSICDAAAELLSRGYRQIRFLIYGAGTQVDELRRYCADRGIDTVKLYGRIEKEQIPSILSQADVCFLSFLDTPLKRYGGSQQKSFEYFASAKPILSNWNSDFNLIKQYGCGVVTKTQSAEEIADGVLRLYEMTPQQRLEMGFRGRKIAEDFAQPILAEKLLDVFAFVEQKGAGGRSFRRSPMREKPNLGPGRTQ